MVQAKVTFEKGTKKLFWLFDEMMQFLVNNKGYLVLIICLGFALGPLQAQNQANIWYFGHKAGFDFSESPPRVLEDGQIQARGSASIADTNGQLLFYTDGDRIWNKEHDIMSNGYQITTDNISFVVSGPYNDTSYNGKKTYIVPHPGDSSLYYIFSSAEYAYYPDTHPMRPQIQYALVDMDKVGGLGKVVKKKQQLLAPSIAMYAAVRHTNGEAIWLVTHPLYSDEFHAYPITRNGLQPQPVISKMKDSLFCKDYACKLANSTLKSAPSGKLLAMSLRGFYNKESLRLYHFDRSTGKVKFLDRNEYKEQHTGDVAFAPNEEFLYAQHEGRCYQIPLKAGECRKKNTRLGTPVSIDTLYNSHSYYGTLQLAPNGNIYAPRGKRKAAMGIINNPNWKGQRCNLEPNGFQAPSNRDSSKSPRIFGKDVPQFPHWMLPREVINVAQRCLGNTTYLSIPQQPYDSVHWHLSGAGRLGEGQQVRHAFQEPGRHKVQAYIYRNNVIDTFRETVCIKQRPDLKLGSDTSICEGTSYRIQLPEDPVYEYQWQDGSQTSDYRITSPGEYWVTGRNGVCESRDTIRVDSRPAPDSELPADTHLCLEDPGASVGVDAGYDGISYDWSTGANQRQIQIKDTGHYEVEILGSNGCVNRDGVKVQPLCRPNIHVPNAFSPYRNDGHNDVFKPVMEYVTEYQLTIYNRWGEKMFETTDPERGWDGTYKGKLAESGVYIYQVEYNGKLSGPRSVSGNLTLIE